MVSMSRRTFRSIAFAIGSLLSASVTPALADPAGLWRGSNGWTMRIAHCGGGYCGFIASTVPVNDPSTGRPMTDKNNPEPSKRKRPLVGVQVLLSMQPNGPGRWAGKLYDCDDGRTYTGYLIERSPTDVRVEGCWLGFCDGDNLTRVR
jgi:uncharacterized protein (DUF2147 family)